MQNKVNLELKYFCNDFAPIRQILKEIGAKKAGVFAQKDYFFNLPSKNEKISRRLKLRIQNNKHTLVYYKRSDFTEGKSTPSDVMLFNVKDKKLLSFLQKILGTKAIVSKKRELWKKENTVFNLDQVEGVGKIFEMELTVEGNEQDAETEFNSYKEKFLPLLDKVVRGSNVDLVLSTQPS